MANTTLREKIEECKARISLLEGDRKAYYENSQWTMKQNKDLILKLRQENRDIRVQLSACLTADEQVLDKAFQDRRVERAALKNKTGQAAIAVLDQKLSDDAKRLNQLKHETASKQQRAAELRTKYEQLQREVLAAAAAAESQKASAADGGGESRDSAVLRSLENRLDKALLKVSEAEQIKKTYAQIKAKLEEEALNFPSRLDVKADTIGKARLELKELKTMHSEALLARDAATKELRKHEEAVYSDRKRRDLELHKIKKEADDARLHQEKMERRIAQRNASSAIEEGSDKAHSEGAPAEVDSSRITSFEEAFRQIKEATGVTDALEVVARFEHQEETSRRLETLKSNAEDEIAQLRAEKVRLQRGYDDLKYSGDAKMSSGQLALEAAEANVAAEETRRVQTLEKVNEQNSTLFKIRSGVEHLYEKLRHLKTSSKLAPITPARNGGSATQQAAPNYDERVLDMLSATEDKLLKLLDDLDTHGVNLPSITEEMQQEEFQAQLEGKLPQHNTRVKLPLTQRDYAYDDDEDDSGDNEGEVVTRTGIKKQAEQLLENKTKKRVVKRKK